MRPVGLTAVPGVEAKVSCGCAFVHAIDRGIDQHGQWYQADVIGGVPCPNEDHVPLLLEVGKLAEGEVIDAQGLLFARLVGEMEQRLAVASDAC